MRKTNLLADNHTVILLHHFGKDSTRGGRGWSGLRAALDFELMIEAIDDGVRVMPASKIRDVSTGQGGLCYRFYGRSLGLDQYGDEVTAVVVEHLADDASETPRKRQQSPKAKKTLGKLWEMIMAPAQSFPLPEHNGLRCVLREELEKECIKLGVVSGSKEDRDRRKVFLDGLDELLKAGAITIDHDRVWPVPKASEEAS